MPRVTVVISTYNWSSVLPYSIGSALRQTFSDTEVLVIGDGCTDDSEAVVRGIADPRVRWINLPQNTGHQSGPNNEGLRQARGELIAYLGHDDLWLPHHLALAVAAMDAGADLTYALTEMVEPGDALPTFEPSEMERYDPGLWIPPTSVVHRAECARQTGGWRSFLEVTRDPEADLWERMHAKGCRFHFIRRLTAVKFPAIWRKDAYKYQRSDEQAAWSARIENEPDFEAVELARMLTPLYADGESARPFREMLWDFRNDVAARLRRKLVRLGMIRPAQREDLFRRRRKFKGLPNQP